MISIQSKLLTLNSENLVSILKNAAKAEKGITIIYGKEKEEKLTYSGLYKKAWATLYYLQKQGVLPNDEIIIQTDDQKKFLIVFWACIMGGIIAIPLAAGTQEEHIRKLINIWRQLKNPYLVNDPEYHQKVEQYCSSQKLDVGQFRLSERRLTLDFSNVDFEIDEEYIDSEIAFIQYSSGSTGDPKGVILTHKNLLANIKDIAERSQLKENEKSLSWIPLTHDMGLICFHLTSILMGMEQYLIPTKVFIRNPILWLDKVNEFKANVLYCPNFGYSYFLSSFGKNKTRHWNLKSVRIIYNGAENIVPNVCREFVEKLQSFGLKENVILPGYGLAEASVVVTLSHPGVAVRAVRLNRDRLNQGDQIECISEDQPGVNFVIVGEPVENCELRICNEENESLKEGQIGQIQIKGKNVTQGYYLDAVKTKRVITQDGWLKTGDLGFLKKDELIITGRLKNIIIINGQTYYPQDIENEIIEQFSLDPGKVVVGSRIDPCSSREELMIFILFKNKINSFIPLILAIKNAINEKFGITASYVLPIRKVPKTTSGKIQHYQLIRSFEEGFYDEQISRINNLLEPATQNNNIATKIARIWTELSGTKNLNFDANLLKFGNNSLLIQQFTNRINDLSYGELTVSDFFENPTIHQIAGLLSKGNPREPLVKPSSDAKQYPLFSTQEKFWLLDKLVKKETLNISLAFQLEGMLQPNKLQQAFITLIKKYEILRSYFKEINGELFQLVVPEDEFEFSIEIEDLQGKEIDQESLKKHLATFARQKFELDQFPLIKAKVFKYNHRQYVFTFCMHHIISDGWSTELMITTLINLYNQLSGELALEVPSLKLQFRDIAIWEQQQLQNGTWNDSKCYWEKELRNANFNINLPTIFTNEIQSGNSTGIISFTIPDEVYRLVEDQSRLLSGTLFISMLTNFIITLYKYSSQTDIVIGCDLSGRWTDQFHQQLGPFIKTAGLRTQVNRDLHYTALYKQVKTKLLQALTHQHYPLEKADLNMNRSLFDVFVIYQDTNISNAFDLLKGIDQSVEIEYDEVDTLTNIYLEIRHERQSISLKLKYDRNRYDDGLMKVMFDYFIKICGRSIHLSNQAIAELYPELQEESSNVTKTFVQSLPTLPITTSIFNIINQQVVRSQDEVAIVEGDVNLTYRALGRKIKKLSSVLKDQYAINEYDRVAILLPNGINYIVSMLASISLRASYVPLDNRNSSLRITHILEESKPKVIISDFNLCEKTIIDSYTVFHIDELDNLECREYLNPVSPQTIDIPAYIMFTSGTTGIPKGVVISSESLTSYVLNFIKYFQLSTKDVVLQQSSMVFDTSVEEIYPILSVGGRLVINQQNNSYIQSLLSTIEKEKVSVVTTTPLVINELNHAQVHVKWNYLRLLISGGDRLSMHQIDRLIQTKINLYNTYGPTETTVCATYQPLRKLQDVYYIGKPIYNIKIFIIDDALHFQPLGAIGEIAIGGKGVAIGYLNNPELNHVKFINLPDSNENVYLTGDLGYWDNEGRIIFKGRKDRQIKVNGYRVEPSEIESILTKYHLVSESVVTTIENVNGPILVGFFMADVKIEESTLMNFVSSHLPDYAVPATLIQVSQIPRTLQNKVDFKALTDRFQNMYQNGKVKKRPINDLQKILIAIWEEVLAVENIGIGDDFYILGGNSIKAVKIANRIHTAFKKKISFNALAKARNIENLSILILQEEEKTDELTRAPELNVYPLSLQQQSLWQVKAFDEHLIAYNLTKAFKIEGSLNINILKKIIELMVEEIEVFKTVIERQNGRYVQRIKDFDRNSFGLKTIDLSSDLNSLKALKEILQKEVNRKFDFLNGPLAYFSLFKLADEQFVFCLNIHHLICDGWSLDVVLNYVKKHYLALENNSEMMNQMMALSYKDYAFWQSQLDKTTWDKIYKRFWKEKLSHTVGKLNIPLLPYRSGIGHKKGKSCIFNLEYKKFDNAFQMCAHLGISHYTFIFYHWIILFYKYGYIQNNQKTCIGSVISGREHNTVEDQVGFFSHLLPIIFKLNEKDSLSKSLINLDQLIREGMDNFIPYIQLLEKLSSTTEGNLNLFNVLISYHYGKKMPDQYSNLLIEPYEIKSSQARYDLSIDMIEYQDRVEFRFEYDLDFFTYKLICTLFNDFTELLDRYLTEQDKTIEEIDIINENTRQQLLKNLNDTDYRTSPNVCLIDKIEEIAARFPSKIALFVEDRTFTYQQLVNNVHQMALMIQKKSRLSKSKVVALMLDRSEWLVIAILGILKSGAAFVPLDKYYPQKRLQYMLEDSECELIISHRHLKEEIRQWTDVEVLSVEESETFIGSIEINKFNVKDTAYIMYTSGSTGQPKGVEVSHENLWNFFVAMNQELPISSTDHLLAITPSTFDISLLELIWPLSNCLQVTICEELKKVSGFNKFLHKHPQISMMQTTPSLLKILLNDEGSLAFLSSLKILIVGGEEFTRDLYHQIGKLYNTRIFNMYGPTETTIWVTTKEIMDEAEITIGKPIANTMLLILDERLRLTPMGTVGEICIGGKNVAKGYKSNKKLTDEKFIDNHFFPKEGKLYRTGDLGRWLDSGEVQYLGRKDRQVKINGQRIELGEIEQTILNTGLVDDIVVQPHQTQNSLIAYCIKNNKSNTENLYLGTVLAELLPHHMIPKEYRVLTEFKLTPNGKIDATALENEHYELWMSEQATPRNKLEQEIGKIWCEILDLDSINVKEHFFSAGGDSLGLTRMLLAINRHFGLELSMKDLLGNLTVEKLAALCKNLPVSDQIQITPIPEVEDYELSHAQRRLWLIDRLDPDNHAYNVPSALSLTGDIRLDYLENSFKTLIHRHEILRTYFIEKNGLPRQVILPAEKSNEFRIEKISIDPKLMDDEREKLVQNLIASEYKIPFKLDEFPLIRCKFIKLNSCEGILLVTLHHIVCDGWSFQVLKQEITALYNGFKAGIKQILKPLPIQYKDFAFYQNQWVTDQRLEKYWLENIDKKNSLIKLPYDYPRAKNNKFRGKRKSITIPFNIAQQIKSITNQLKITSATFMFTLFNILIHQITQQREITVAVSSANRVPQSVEPLIGFFSNLLIISTRFNQDLSLWQLFSQIHNQLIDAFDHQIYPVDRLVEKLHPERVSNYQSMFNVAFTYENHQNVNLNLDYVDGVKLSDRQIDGLSIVYMDENSFQFTSKFDLLLFVTEQFDGWKLTFEYNNCLFKDDTIRKYLAALNNYIESTCEDFNA